MNNKTLPKGISKHGDGYMVSKMIGGKRYTKKVDSLPEAEKTLAKFIKELTIFQKGIKTKPIPGRVPTQSMSLEKAYERTVESIWQGTGGERSAKLNASGVLAYFGRDTAVEKIHLEWIDEWIQSLWKSGNSGSTINRKLSCLSRILRTAQERGRLDNLPKMPRQKENQHRIRVISEAEEEELLTHFAHMGFVDHWDATMILLYTGFRPGELWRVECQDIDLEQGTITVWVTKTARPRTVPIVKKIKPVLQSRIEKVGGKGKIFPGCSVPWFRRGWERVRALMGLDDDPQFIPYICRHTCASRLARKGVTMMIIKEWLGHSTIQTTARYTHFAPKDLLGAAAVFDE